MVTPLTTANRDARLSVEEKLQEAEPLERVVDTLKAQIEYTASLKKQHTSLAHKVKELEQRGSLLLHENVRLKYQLSVNASDSFSHQIRLVACVAMGYFIGPWMMQTGATAGRALGGSIGAVAGGFVGLYVCGIVTSMSIAHIGQGLAMSYGQKNE